MIPIKIIIETDAEHLFSLTDEALIELWYGSLAAVDASPNGTTWVTHTIEREIIKRFILREIDPSGEPSMAQ